MGSPRRPVSPRERAKGRRILVVEDDPEMRQEMSSALSAEGFKVELARDGYEALGRLHWGAPPDVIVLDLVLPPMAGWEFRAAQLADPELASIPVVAMSGDESPQAKAVHADHYLGKPFDIGRVALGRRPCVARSGVPPAGGPPARFGAPGRAGHHHGERRSRISNPLTYVIANLAELKRALGDSGDTALRDLVQQTQQGALRIRTVVTTLRALSRKDDQSKAAVDLGVLLETSIAMTWNQICQKARLVRDLAEAPIVLGNEGRLVQLFINLLANAAQAIPEGAPESNEIQVRTRTELGNAVVEVTDSGLGIPPEARARLFEPFFTTKEPGAGTGLGLAISRDIVIEHGGRIEVESAPGQGATFRVVFPLQPAPVEASGADQHDTRS